MKTNFKIESPRVALLSVGTEDQKGNQLVLDTFPLIKQMKNINFVGNMEARDALSGKYDVIVTDGFGGNVLLKGIEGALKTMMEVLKTSMMSSLKSKIGALLLKKSLKKELKRYDYEQYGGAVLLGTKQIVVKAHGSSKAKQILANIEQVINFANNDLLNKLSRAMSEIEVVEEEQPVEQEENK